MPIRREILIFKALDRPKNIGELSEEVGISPSTASFHIAGMVEKGLVEKERRGKKVYVARARTQHALILSELMGEYPRLPFEDLLSHSRFDVLGVMSSPRGITGISEAAGLSRQSVSSAVRDLRRYGILLKEGRSYYLNPRHGALKEFIASYWSFINRGKASSLAEDAVILWQRGKEFLFKSKKEIKAEEVTPTAISVFPDYGVQMLSDLHYYFHSPRRMSASDHILHTILIGPERVTYNSYALLLYQKTIPRDILAKAELYDLKGHMETLLEYLKRKEKVSDYTPPWDEYRELASC
jgi:DNA-binding transcriptional ArsR family regulator